MGDDDFGRQDEGGGETRVFALMSRSELTVTVGSRVLRYTYRQRLESIGE